METMLRLNYLSILYYLFHLSWIYLVVSVDEYDISSSSVVLYSDITTANTSESYTKIKSVPLKVYEFQYDSVQGRKQLGVIGPDAQKYFPDAVEVVPQYSFLNRNRSETITLHNFPVIDKNVILMHGLAALQELIVTYEEIVQTVERIKTEDQKVMTWINEIREIFDKNEDQAKIEEIQILRNEEILLNEKIESEKSITEQLLVLEETNRMGLKTSIEHEELLLTRRLQHEENLLREALSQKIELEKKLAEQRELLRRESHQQIQLKREEYNKLLESKKVELEKEKITAELEAKAKQEIANEDLTIRRIQLQAKLDTDRMIEIVRATSQQITMIISEFLSKPQQLALCIASILVVFIVYYVIREILLMIKTFLQSRLGRPSLVRETSYEWTLYALLSSLCELLLPWWLFLQLKSLLFKESNEQSLQYIQDQFRDVILSVEDKERVIQLTLATRNTKRSSAPYRHVMLFGPPGTGKTLIARKLAKSSGMDYAIMSGGDIGPLGEDAVNQLHNLFEWASRSRKGLLIFIDEAEAFLSSRAYGGQETNDNNHLKHALNALLYQTGTQSKSFMLVLATNRPDDIDFAILDRIDLSICINLPEVPERIALMKLYFDIHVMSLIRLSQRNNSNNMMMMIRRVMWKWFWLHRQHSNEYRIEEDCWNNEDLWQTIASQCQGFSGREISKLFISLQYSLRLSAFKVLTRSLLEQTVRMKIYEHNQKLGFRGHSHENNGSSGSLGNSQAMESQNTISYHQNTENISYNGNSIQASTPRKTPRRSGSRKPVAVF